MPGWFCWHGVGTLDLMASSLPYALTPLSIEIRYLSCDGIVVNLGGFYCNWSLIVTTGIYYAVIRSRVMCRIIYRNATALGPGPDGLSSVKPLQLVRYF